MAKSSTPPSLALLQIVIEELENILPVLIPFSELTEMIKESRKLDSLDENPRFSKTPMVIRYVQVLLLAALTLHEGILVPSLNQVSRKEDHVNLTWEGGIRDRFVLGIYDTSFKNFVRMFRKKVLNLAGRGSEVSYAVLEQTVSFIEREMGILNLCRAKLSMLSAGKDKALSVIQDDFNSDMLFILMSSLPTEVLNTLYLYLNQFFPSDLVVRIPHPVQVGSLLQTPTQDEHYLMEKTRLYYFLYLSNDQPIIQHITRAKTREFLQQLVQSDAIYNVMSNQLQAIIQNQMDPRLGVYAILVNHFRK